MSSGSVDVAPAEGKLHRRRLDDAMFELRDPMRLAVKEVLMKFYGPGVDWYNQAMNFVKTLTPHDLHTRKDAAWDIDVPLLLIARLPVEVSPASGTIFVFGKDSPHLRGNRRFGDDLMRPYLGQLCVLAGVAKDMRDHYAHRRDPEAYSGILVDRMLDVLHCLAAVLSLLDVHCWKDLREAANKVKVLAEDRQATTAERFMDFMDKCFPPTSTMSHPLFVLMNPPLYLTVGERPRSFRTLSKLLPAFRGISWSTLTT